MVLGYKLQNMSNVCIRIFDFLYRLPKKNISEFVRLPRQSGFAESPVFSKKIFIHLKKITVFITFFL